MQALDVAGTEDLDALSPQRLAAANINPVTGLATDYLNHFNNVVMLLELIGVMPEMAGEILDWEPVSYPDYFASSHFREKDLAIRAYHAAKPEYRAAFDSTVAELNAAMAEAKTMLALCDPPTDEIAIRIGLLVVERMKTLVSEAGGIVNGRLPVKSKIEIDTEAAQASVDELFP